MKATVSEDVLNKAESLTDENVGIYHLNDLPKRVQPDIREMISILKQK